MEKHIVFLTRKFPPQKGGMETFSYQLTQQYPGPKYVIARGKKQRDIIWVIPALTLQGIKQSSTAAVYHLGDLVLAPVALFLKLFTSVPIVATVHGLELTFRNSLLKWLIRISLSSIDHFVAVSNNTALMLEQWGIPRDKISVIVHGAISKSSIHHTSARKKLCDTLQFSEAECSERFVLLSVGRLVKRKGVEWFIRNVMPQLKTHASMKPLYLIVSTGPEKDSIEKSITELGLVDYVRLLGNTNNDLLQNLYEGSDVFIMPNISVQNDVEGFGFVAIEAAMNELPVVASNIEGIPDAIHDGKNGKLVEASNPQSFRDAIESWFEHSETRTQFGKSAREYTIKKFSWKDRAQEYKELFDSLINT